MARGAGAALAALVVLALAGPAAAATPQQISQRIFADLADNGRIDGPYTDAQINRALHSPPLQGYNQPARPVLQSPAPPPSASVAGDRGSLPFSGIDLALFGGFGAPLLLLGASLGRLGRVKTQEELG